MLKRNGNATSRYIAEMAGLLRDPGRILNLPEAHRNAQNRLTSRNARTSVTLPAEVWILSA